MLFIQGFLLVTSSLFLLYMTIYSIAHRKTLGACELFTLGSAAIIWTMGTFFELYAPTFQGKLFWRNIQQIGAFTVPIATLFFAVAYTMKTYLKKYLWYSALIPAITILLIFTNEYHHIMRSGYALEISTFYGQYLVVHSTVIGSILVGFDFLLPFLAVMLLFDFARKVSPGFRKQVYLVIISIMLTLIMTWLKMTVLDDFGIFIYVSVLYTPSAGILFYALFKYNFFSLSPIARDKVFEIIDQGILVMNNEGFIVDANAYAIDLIKKMGDFKNSPVGFKIEDIYDTFPTAQEMTQAYKEGKQEVKIARGMGEIYISLNYYPLYNNGRESIGSVLMISNITQQKLHELKLEERADRDPLTRLLNRNGFQNTYMHRRKKWYGNQTPISVFMMDLDNFKKINDTYGHTNGDKILCHFAQLLTGLLREEDIIGRIGGEEFSIILPHIRKETAFKIAERIRQKVAESQVVLSDNQMISYTVSIGITDNDANEKSLWDILKEADMALYQAKEMSRNCSVIYNPAKD